jgi:Caspase domain
MSQKLNSAIAVIGIDIGKNSFHLVGLDKRGAIVLRQKWSRGQVEARLANMQPCLIGMEACVGAHHLSRKPQALGHDARLMPATEALSDRSVSLLGAIAQCNKRVLELSQGLQRPYYTSDLNGDVYLFRQFSSRQRIAVTMSVDRVEGHQATLFNVANDAAAWAGLLKRAGFETTTLRNPKHAEMKNALGIVSSTVQQRRGSLGALPIHPAALQPVPTPAPKRSDTVVFVFYSGVGFTLNGMDYLAASDTRIDRVAETSIDLRRALDRLREENAVTIVAIDTNFNVVAASSQTR